MKIQIEVAGCDASTVFEMSKVTDQEVETILRVAALCNAKSTCQCEPRMFVRIKEEEVDK